MKKCCPALLMLLLVILLCACTSQPGAPSGPEPVPPLQIVDLPEEPTPTPYTGTLVGYQYRYENERDRKWEEDVLFLAEKFLTGHPCLADDNFYTLIRTIEGTSPIEDYRYDNSYYDPQLRAEFIAQTNTLLGRIAHLSDTQVFFEMQKLAAMLHDTHSGFYLFHYWTKRLRIQLECFTVSNGLEFCVTAVPTGQETLLYSRLISINGVSIEEIVDQMSQHLASEVTGHLPFYMSKYHYFLYLEHLQAIGVAGAEDTEAELVFEADGEIITCKFPFLTQEEYVKAEQTDVRLETRGIPRFRHDKTYWFELLEDKTLYIRFLSMMEEENYSPYDMARDISVVLRDAERPLKVVIDFRDNGGGYSWDLHNLVDSINRHKTDGVYILINEYSASAAVIEPYVFYRTIDDAVLVGTPAAQPVCFFAHSDSDIYRLPNSGHAFRVSDTYKDMDPRPEHMDQPLTPDILVYPTLEDYKNGIDTVLEYVLAQ